jgi:glycosyltransferase involved in cell wall biosynthesis
MTVEHPLRILRIIARLNIGGPAIQAVALSGAFSKWPYESLLVCGRVGRDEGDMSYLAEERGVQPQILPQLGRELSPIEDLRSFMAIRKIIKRFRPQIIHTHTAKAGTLGRLAALSYNLFRCRRERIRVFHTFHGHVFHSYFGFSKGFIFIQIERLLARFTDWIIVISPSQRDDICQRFKITDEKRVKIIPLGFDLSGFVSQTVNNVDFYGRKPPSRTVGALRVGVVGRLTHIKNHRMLLEAAKCLNEEGKSDLFTFLIIGDGELRDELARYAAELGVQGSVVFTGWQKDMPALYRDLDVVVLTSLNEGTPVSLIEAMAASKAVVSTAVGSVPDLLGEIQTTAPPGCGLTANGILVPSGDARMLARALVFLSENDELRQRMGAHAREHIIARYSLERLVKDIETLYHEAFDR